MTRIGILSFAHMHAYSYADALNKIDGVDLVGIWNEDGVRGDEYARHFNTRFYQDSQVLLQEGLDGVLICSDNASHRELTELAAQHTRHILCEKPIATTLEDARAMIEVCE